MPKPNFLYIQVILHFLEKFLFNISVFIDFMTKGEILFFFNFFCVIKELSCNELFSFVKICVVLSKCAVLISVRYSSLNSLIYATISQLEFMFL